MRDVEAKTQAAVTGREYISSAEESHKYLALLIGDVAGKGAAAAGSSAMTRFFVEARSWSGDGPGEILAQTDVDGALVGGASLDGAEFAGICIAAAGGPLAAG